MLIATILKVSYLDFFRRKASFLRIAFILSFGLSALYSTLSLKNQLLDHLQREAKYLLTSDLSINVRRAISDEEYKQFKNAINKFQHQESKEITLLTLVSLENSNNPYFPLSFNIKWVDKGYPFYSKAKFASSDNTLKSWEDLHLGQYVYINIEHAKRFDLKIGDSLNIFGDKYIIKDFFIDTATLGSRFFSFFPTAFVSLNHVQGKSKLLGPQTSFFESRHIKWQQPLSFSDQEQLKKDLENKLKDPALKVNMPKDSSEQNQRLWDTVTDFLGILTLCAMLLSFLGLITLVQFQWVGEQITHKQLFLLGFSNRDRVVFKFFQILFLSIITTIIALFFSWPMSIGLMSLLPNELRNILSFWDINSFSLLIFYVNALLIFVSFYFYKSDKGLYSNIRYNSWTKTIISTIIVFTVVIILGRYLVRSWFLSFLVTILITILYALFLGMVKGLLSSFSRFFQLPQKLNFSNNKQVILRLVFSSWKKNYFIYAMTVACLGLVYFLLMLLLSLHASLKYQFTFSAEKPDVFLFDVQPEDRDSLNYVTQEIDKNFLKFYPMVRGRIVSINGISLSREEKILNPTREEEEQSRFKFRAVNASYQSQLGPHEKILFGEPIPPRLDFKADLQQIIPISLENRYAKRLKVKLGDQIEFDFQGFKIKTVIRNIRYVHWLSLHPNFFIIFPDGILNEVPQSYLAVAKFSSDASLEVFLKKMTLEFNHISMLLLKQTADLVWQQMSLLMKAFFLLSSLFVGLGFFLWISVLFQRLQMEKNTIILLFKLGLSLKQIRLIYLLEFIGSFLLIILTTPLLSYIAAKSIAHEFFDDLLLWPILDISALTIILVLPMLVFAYIFVKRFCRI